MWILLNQEKNWIFYSDTQIFIKKKFGFVHYSSSPNLKENDEEKYLNTANLKYFGYDQGEFCQNLVLALLSTKGEER